jgi:hypothetical protein
MNFECPAKAVAWGDLLDPDLHRDDELPGRQAVAIRHLTGQDGAL